MQEKFLNLRVLAEYNSTYKVFMAQCLETGSIVTADDEETAKSMITELLEDEISYAVKHRNIGNLFSTPAPLEIWSKWFNALKTGKPEEIPLNDPVLSNMLAHVNLGEQPEISIATAA